MAHGEKVNINVLGKEENTQNHLEEIEILRKETIIARPNKGYYYEFELAKGDHLKGEISSTDCVNIYFVDEFNFDKWNREKSFEFEGAHEDVLETIIDFLTPKKGQWYLIIENNGRKRAEVKVRLY